MGDSSDDRWVVLDPLGLPPDIVAGAAAAQATLNDKLDTLRSVPLEFPHAIVPADADRWIADGGRRVP